jgi:D-alanine--poly(phosphoribitol) ligase subunit 2
MKEQIKKYILETFMYGEGQLEDDDQLFESGIIDSMGFIKLLSHIEETFKVSISMDEVSMENFSTVNDIIGVINEKLNKA